MKAASSGLLLVAALAATSLSGCFASKSELTASETQNRVLVEQNRAQLVEIENLKTHSKQVEDQLIHAEQDLVGIQQKRPGNSPGDMDPLHRDFQNLAYGRRLPETVRQQLIALSQRCSSLHFDPETGISKLDTDVLFDSGQAELKPAARQMLLELAQILQLAEAKDLKVMVVGHTDNQRITGGPAREKYGNNFHLSTARALAVADLLRSQGLTDHRLGVAGFGSHQPVVPNDSATDRQKNRRVEIFVMAPDVPIVGWSESAPGAYY